jgi:glycosyltransferase involved in cell wall biosynthesis
VKVLIIAQYFPPDMGGGASRAFNIAKGLLKKNCTVTVVTAFPHYPNGNIPKRYKWKPFSIEYIDDIKTIRTFVPAFASEGVFKRILLFCSFIISSLFSLFLVNDRVDIVWAANPNIISFYPSLIFSMIKHCPIIQNVDDLWPEALYDLGFSKKSFTARFGEYLAKIAYRMVSALTPISSAYVDVISNKYKVDSRKICVIPAGVDLDRFSKYQQDVKKDDKKFVILYIGALSLAYNFEQVFKAAKLLDSYDDLEFVIQGGGELTKLLKSRVKELKLINVKVVDRIVSRNEVARIMHEANVLLLPLSGIGSIEKGISSKLYEYQASGKPIICCSNGTPGEFVHETKSGIVVKPRDYKALAEAILYLKDNKAIATQFKENGKKYVQNHFSLEKIGKKMIMLLKKISSYDVR